MVMKRSMVAFLIQLYLLFGRRSRGLRPSISSCAAAGSSTAQVPDAHETVENRSPAVGRSVPQCFVAPGHDHDRPDVDPDQLSPTRFPRPLAVEVPPRRRRSRTDSGIRALIRRMNRENRCGDAPRIHGELSMLGIEVAESTVGRYMVRRRRQTTVPRLEDFPRNHAVGIASLDLFVAS